MDRLDMAMLIRLGQSVFLIWLAAWLVHPVTTQPGTVQAASLVRDRLDPHEVPPGNTPSRAGIIVPLYIYPGTDWDRLVQAKNNYPRVPMIAVINPADGPGSDRNASYVRGIQTLHDASIIVLGYVHTAYASRSREAGIADIDTYAQWYELDGIFFDEMSAVAGNEDYYAALTSYSQSVGFRYTIANPAVSTLPGYIDTVNTLVVYEDAGLPPTLPLADWHDDYARRNFALIAHSVESIDQSFVAEVSGYVSYMYITNDTLPNPYDTLPGYFEQLVAALSELPPGNESH